MLQIDYRYFVRKNIFVASAVLASFTAVLLQTEREGRTGEYWPEVMAVRTERTQKRPRANISQYDSS